MARFRPTTKDDWLRTILFVVLLMAALLIGLLVLRPRFGWPATAIWVVVCLLILVRWTSRAYGYRCAACGKDFQVPTVVNFFTPQGIAKRPDGTYYSWKSLTCPHCRKRSKAMVVKRADLRGSGRLVK
jgi:DNA-directed RNA polymerase subunit RPC12/RpoP